MDDENREPWAALQVFTNDNESFSMTLNAPKIVDFYGLDFSGGASHQSLVVLIARLSDMSIPFVENLQYQSIMKLSAAISERMDVDGGGPSLKLV